MKKTASRICIGMIAMIGSVFADDTLNDCNIVTETNFNGTQWLFELTSYTNVVPVDAFNIAIIHLQAYCCNEKKILCSDTLKNKLPTEKNYPQSPYLFDHLIDVTMRRLDGIPELAYGLPPDKAGEARRKTITKFANNTNGEHAETIKDTFTSYRTLNKKNTKDLEKVKERFGGENIEGFSLADRYNTVCKLMKGIYEEIQDKKTEIGGEFEDNSFFKKCKNMVKERVDREQGYTKLIIVKQSSQLLNKTTEAYTQTYFVEEKLMWLWKLISNVKDLFETIVQQAPTSKSCSK